MTETIDLKNIKKIHFTGIKGVGMTALALCSQDLGMTVTGSDIEESFVTDKILSKRGVAWKKGFSKEHVDKETDLLIFTGAHAGEANIEVLTAVRLAIPVLSHAQALGIFAAGKYQIATCGVGGKSTTASILATVFDKSAKHPSFAVGVGNIEPLGVPGKYDSLGKDFILEADEYFASTVDRKPRFSYLNPKVVILTNLEYDHPDVYENVEAVFRAFASFVKKIPANGLLIACWDNLNVRRFLKRLSGVPYTTYGKTKGADWVLENIKDFSFSLKAKDKTIGPIKLQVPGEFNKLNASAAAIAADFSGIDTYDIKIGIQSYLGTKRRLEKIADISGIDLYDDYAHHPTEINATLKAVRSLFPKRRIIVIFQPHTYSRTRKLLEEFSSCFSFADIVIITDIYASAREAKDCQINSQIVVNKIIAKGKKIVKYLFDIQSVTRFLNENARKGDIIITMGAGDIFSWHDKIKAILKNRQ